MPIRVLPPDVVAQIAAGEVVERPASAVKELLENSIDAGATTIQISIRGGGRRRILIQDDGSGIRADEIDLVFMRHATSKLETADDLYQVRTLGFRGEAVASIASVSQMSITTRHIDEQVGTYALAEAGAIQQRRAIGTAAGTQISVENLFFNTPARLKFMKKELTEKRQITTVVSRYAMAYPNVRFLLEQDGREVLRTSAGETLADVLVTVLGLDTVRILIEVDDAQDGIAVRGYTSAPSFTRADRTQITLFVNGRWIQDTKLSYAVIQAYHTLLMTGRFPAAVLMLEMPPEEVDVNVHPTKAEVRFRDADRVFAAVQRAVRRAVIDQARTPTMRGRQFAIPERDTEAYWRSRGRGAQLSLDVDTSDSGQHARHRALMNGASGMVATEDEEAIPETPGAPAKPRTLPPLRVIGQVGGSYIVAEGPAGMYLIDQHAAHERILYEQYMAEYARQKTVVQLTLAAQTIQLAPDAAQLVESHLPLLEELGFGLEVFGPNTFVIRSIPAILADSDPTEMLLGIVSDFELDRQPGQQSIEDIIIRRACRFGAVKAGQILTYEQMQGIIRQLERCQQPLTCPHGRPTLVHLSSERLAREFGRS